MYLAASHRVGPFDLVRVVQLRLYQSQESGGEHELMMNVGRNSGFGSREFQAPR